MKIRTGEEDNSARKSVRLRPVAISNLPWGTSTPVDLYMLQEQELSLLFRKGQPLTTDAFDETSRLTDKLYYNRDENIDWQALIDQNLSAILQSPLTPKAKAAVAYGATARRTQQIFSEFNQEAYQTAQETVDAINKLFEQPGALESFFELTIHDYYTYTHSVHVYIYASLLTRAVVGTSDIALLQDVGVGYLLHDVGKKDISLSVLNKPGKLNDEEWELIKKHPIIGHELLTQVSGGLSEEVTQIVLQHHEKCNGAGYPYGLKRPQIGLFGRLCAIADVYDALTTNRSYKQALTRKTALTLMTESEGHFDPKLLARFVELALPLL